MIAPKLRSYFSDFGLEERIQEFSVSSATVELAAQALGCQTRRIAKTLAFSLSDGPILVVAAGDAKVDNPRFKACFHEKARMLTPEETLAQTGYAVGGVCPFSLPDGIRVFLDESLRRFETVFPACGNSSSAVELTPAELEKTSCCSRWVDVCKGWRDAE